MIVTEEEAKGKLCPEITASAQMGILSNCDGSGCMMWRWEDNDKGPRDASIPRKGFCGKAGFPLEILDES